MRVRMSEMMGSGGGDRTKARLKPGKLLNLLSAASVKNHQFA
jgi:hypothetical protein